MLENHTSLELEKNIMERIDKMYADDNFAKAISQLAAKIAVIALQEYEKLNTQQK